MSDQSPTRSFRHLAASEIDFSTASIFRKTAVLMKANVETSDREQDVITTIGGIEETHNTAKPGDKIITGIEGERYVLSAEKFGKLYEEDPNDISRFISKNVVRAVQVHEPVEIIAPWGETQRTEAGGYVVQSATNPNDVYLIEKNAFKKTYALQI